MKFIKNNLEEAQVNLNEGEYGFVCDRGMFIMRADGIEPFLDAWDDYNKYLKEVEEMNADCDDDYDCCDCDCDCNCDECCGLDDCSVCGDDEEVPSIQDAFVKRLAELFKSPEGRLAVEIMTADDSEE